MKRALTKIKRYYLTLNSRERAIVLGTMAAISVYFSFLTYEAARDYFHESEETIVRRQLELATVNSLLKRYNAKVARLNRVKNTFSKSQMTFEQVTAELDRIVRESIGSDNYDLNKTQNPVNVSDRFQKQEFTLRVRSLDFEQLVTLLYNLENGEAPLFLGKVDILSSRVGGTLSATLEVFSISSRNI